MSKNLLKRTLPYLAALCLACNNNDKNGILPEPPSHPNLPSQGEQERTFAISDYAPLHIGDRWLYASSQGSHETEVIGTKRIDGKSTIVVEDGGIRSYVAIENGEYRFYGTETDIGDVLLDPPIVAGNSQISLGDLFQNRGNLKAQGTVIGEYRSSYRYSNSLRDFTVPAGKFSNTLGLFEDTLMRFNTPTLNLDVSGTLEQWSAFNVGTVEGKLGTVELELLEAVVNGIHYPANAKPASQLGLEATTFPLISSLLYETFRNQK